MEYELIRTRRKTIAIYIQECRVVVRAPLRAPARDIDSFVESKQKWIGKHLALQNERKANRDAFKLDYGSIVLYLGREYRIDSDNKENTLYMPPEQSREQIREKLVRIYKEYAQDHITKRVAHFSPIIGVYPKNIRIGSAKRSWASCTSSGRLTFSWRLMMAPPDAIDYVVVHELAHIMQPNHSQKFWKIIERILPDWKERRKKLRLLQNRLSDVC